MNLWAILVAAIVAFVASAIYYIIFAGQRAKLSPAAKTASRPSPTQVAIELVRNIVLAIVLAYLIEHLNITPGGAAIYLALPLWVAFPVILLSGSVMYEKVPPKLAAIHGGDWLIKLLVMCAIIGNWR